MSCRIVVPWCECGADEERFTGTGRSDLFSKASYKELSHKVAGVASPFSIWHLDYGIESDCIEELAYM